MEVLCPNATLFLHLPQIGILTADKSCIIKWGEVIIKKTDEIYVNNSVAYEPLNIRKVTAGRNFEKHDLKIHTDKLDKLSERVKNLQEEEEEISLHNVHHYTAPYLVCVVVLIVLYIQYRVRKKNEPHRNFIIGDHISV